MMVEPVKRRLIIAIDGPAGAGKSTVARAVARALGYLYVDTGAMYRALALKVLEQGVDPEDRPTLARLATETDIRLEPGESLITRVFLDGREVTDRIRDPEVGSVVSRVAGVPEVRRELTLKQRQLARPGGVVLEGRDTASQVVPEADLKIFLTAERDERVRRRYREMVRKGYAVEPERVAREIEERDRLDSTREVAPLVKAPDALVIDSTELSIEAVIRHILAITGTDSPGPALESGEDEVGGVDPVQGG